MGRSFVLLLALRTPPSVEESEPVDRSGRPDGVPLTRPAQGWVPVAVGAGLLTVLLTQLVAFAAFPVFGPTTVTGAADAGSDGGGPLAVGVSVLLLAVVTPIGQGLLFRGIVTTVLLRYGAVVGVASSALIFALPRGLSPALATAFILGPHRRLGRWRGIGAGG